MEVKELTVNFTETATDEITALLRDMQLIPIVDYLRQTDEPVPDSLKEPLSRLLSVISDLFSISVPDINDPESTLRSISRDINLGRILRERGLFRLYRLLQEVDKNGLPLFMGIINPVFGHPFAKREEFIGWFCDEAHVSRSLVFMRLAAIDRTLALGFSLDETFNLILRKPFVVGETLHLLAEKNVVRWDGDQIAGVNPDKVLALARQVSPELAENIEHLVNTANDDPQAMEELKDAVRPVLANLLTDVSLHDRSKDALRHVRHNILSIPEVGYTWDEVSNTLMVELQRREVDPETGNEVLLPPIMVPFVPDVIELPTEIKADLLRRLPIKNRTNLDI